MYRYLLVRIDLRDEVPVDIFGYERAERRQKFREINENFVERKIRRYLVVVELEFPETAAAAPYVPVGKFVEELFERCRCGHYFEFIEVFADLFNEPVEF